MTEELPTDITQPWDRQENEPADWYRIFRNYYLPLKSNRSLRNAFELYLRTESPQNYTDVDPDSFKYIPGHWSEYARKFSWAARATAYDESEIPDVAQLQVQMVLDYLRDSSMLAAQSLVTALSNPRTAVQAANAILNRGGVPETTKLDVTSALNISSDDMDVAKRKIEQWKESKNES